MPWIIAVVVAIVAIACFLLFAWALDNDCNLLAFPSFGVGVVSAIVCVVLVINAICWTTCIANIEACRADVAARGIVYEELARDYEQILMPNDVTAAGTYMDLYSKILSYNKEVRKADKWENTWWAEGLLYDPSYTEAEVIPITVG